MVDAYDNDLPPEYTPIYSASTQNNYGLAEGGPRDGEILSSNALTQFVSRPYRPPPRFYNETLAEQLVIHNQWQADLAYDRAHPDRYDYDIDRKVWVWVMPKEDED